MLLLGLLPVVVARVVAVLVGEVLLVLLERLTLVVVAEAVQPLRRVQQVAAA
jgi:hypothetical protein